MKLRNKKTGKIINGCFVVCEYEDGARFGVKDKPVFDSLAELNEEWEDYKPKEPLIKDEKIRKAVRAWAEINDLYSVEYKEDSNGAGFDCIKSTDELVRISFASLILPLEKNRAYTIAELCEDEEE